MTISVEHFSRTYGDLTAKKLGVSAEDVKKLKGRIDHFYHLAAVYDLNSVRKTDMGWLVRSKCDA